MGWIIKEYEFDLETAPNPHGMKSVSVYHGSVLYKEENGQAVPVEVNMSTSREKAKAKKSQYKISRFVAAPSSRAEFRLAKFGLGDLETAAADFKRRRNYLSALFVGAAFAIGGLLLAGARLLRKKARSLESGA